MAKFIGKIFSYLSDAETWERVYYFLRVKPHEDGKIPLTKKDIVPILLAFTLILLFLYVVILIVTWLYH